MPDVVLWNIDVFGAETDGLIRKIDVFTTDYGVYDPFDDVEDLLWEAFSDRAKVPQLHKALVALLDRLRRERNSPAPD